MKRLAILMVTLGLLLAGCSFAEDLTPPSDSPTFDGGQPLPQASPTLPEQEAQAPTSYPAAQPSPAQGTASPTLPEQTPDIASGAIADSAAFNSIRGHVVNGTEGGSVPAGLEVILHGVEGEREVVSDRTTVSESGGFLFEEIEAVAGRVYYATTEWQGIVYGSNAAHLPEADEPLDLWLTIYDTTEVNSPVQVDRLHLVLDTRTEGVLRVMEIWALSNLGDRTVIAAGGRGPVSVALPEGASNLLFDDGVLGGRYQSTDRGFVDTFALTPGSYTGQLVFSFELPYKRRMEFAQPADHPVAAAIVLVPGGGPKVSGDGVQDLGVQDVAGTPMQTYAVGPLEPGEMIAFSLSGSTSASASLQGQDPLLGVVIGGGVLGVVLVALGLWWYRSLHRSEVPETVPLAEMEMPPTSSPTDEDRKVLLQAIADLDEVYESGEIEEEDYLQRRAKLKNQVLDLMKGWDD